MNSIRNTDDVLDLVKAHLGFLFLHNFKLVKSSYLHSTFWRVVLEGKCMVSIGWDRGGVTISLAKCNTDADKGKWYSLNVLIYFLSGKMLVIEDLSRYSTEEQISKLSGFFRAYEKELIEFVASEQLEKHDFELQKLFKDLVMLFLQRPS